MTLLCLTSNQATIIHTVSHEPEKGLLFRCPSHRLYSPPLPGPLQPPTSPSSADNYLLVLRKVILRHRQIQRRGAFPRPARDVVVRAVAGAEPAAEVAAFADGDAA